MYRHVFGQLNARVEDGTVRLAFYLTTPVFSALKDAQLPDTIRIHRQCESEFTWGQHYAEHFDGMDVGKAQIIFEGPINPINNRKFEFLDEDVEIGQTYVYWISCPLGRLPTGPVAVRVRDPRIWWPHHEVESRLSTIAKEHPDLAAIEQYGTTVGDHTIPGLRVGNRDRCIALVGTIHAGESGPELVIPAVERLLKENADLLTQTGVAILPNVNIDERERLVQGCPWYLRTNARGVDINRNFDVNWEQVEYGYGLISDDPDAGTYRGPKPESEPETQAVVEFLTAVAPKAVFSYHALASITGACFLAPREGENDNDYIDACNTFAGPFVAAFCSEEFQGMGVRFGASAGSLPAYSYSRLGVPGFDLEWDGNPDSQPSHNDKTTHEMLKTYQERHYHGLVATLKACATN